MTDNVIYLRTSTEDQNPENQLKDCVSLANKLNIKEYEVVPDKQSAWNDNKEREGFERVRKAIKTGSLKVLIVWDFDRLYRNRLKFKEFLSLLKAYKVKLYSYRQAWLEELHKIPEPWNDIVSDLMINIYGHIAEDESNKKSSRVKAATRKKEGITYSYKGNKWGRTSLSTQKKNLIREAYRQNKTLRQIALELKIGVGTVHKYLTEIKRENLPNRSVLQ